MSALKHGYNTTKKAEKPAHPESSPENVPIVAGVYVVVHDDGIGIRNVNGDPVVKNLSDDAAQELAKALNKAASG